jgi:fumarylpyruvate hydrolase
MIWNIPEQIAILSRSMEIKAGDLIYSGTPAGVGPLLPDDVCVVEIEGLGQLTTTITARASE